MASRAQIKAEVERLAIAGSVVIVALLLVAFGSLQSLAIAVLPVATGVLAGISAVSLGFGQVHGVTLGFGTTLIGEAVDYAIYYLIQARGSAPAAGTVRPASGVAGWRHWLHHSWPTVRLGLLTSLCGFAALVFSGFPGLAQLGVFSIAGLTAAALATRYVFPIVAPDGAPGGGLRRHLGRATARMADLLPHLRRPLQALALVAVVVLWILPSPWRGNLSSLNPVGADAIAMDEQLRADVGAAENGTLVALPAADEAGALAAAEAAGARLDKLVAEGALQGYASPARLLPSPATQAARRAALPDAPTLAAALASATADGPLPAARLGGFIADVEAARTQPLIDRAALEGTPLAPAVDALWVRGQPGQPWRVFLSLDGGAAGVDPAKVRSRARRPARARRSSTSAASSARSTRATCARRRCRRSWAPSPCWCCWRCTCVRRGGCCAWPSRSPLRWSSSSARLRRAARRSASCTSSACCWWWPSAPTTPSSSITCAPAATPTRTPWRRSPWRT